MYQAGHVLDGLWPGAGDIMKRRKTVRNCSYPCPFVSVVTPQAQESVCSFLRIRIVIEYASMWQPRPRNFIWRVQVRRAPHILQALSQAVWRMISMPTKRQTPQSLSQPRLAHRSQHDEVGHIAFVLSRLLRMLRPRPH